MVIYEHELFIFILCKLNFELVYENYETAQHCQKLDAPSIMATLSSVTSLTSFLSSGSVVVFYMK